MPFSLLITSTGRVSRHVIFTLLSSPHCPAIRVIAKAGSGMEETLPAALSSPPHSIALVEHFEGEQFRSIFKDIDIVFHDGPLMDPREVGVGNSVIDAAKAAGARYFVLCTSFQPIRSKLAANNMRLAIEEYLIESRLDYAILQPGMFMQNLALDVAVKSGKIPMGFSSDVVHGFIDLADLATVVRTVILNPATHNRARYELIGENICYNDIARIVSKQGGSQVRCDVMPIKQYIALISGSMYLKNEYGEQVVERMMYYYDRWSLEGNSNILEHLLGRPPTKWEQYVRRELEDLGL